jgi:hypothetical protein
VIIPGGFEHFFEELSEPALAATSPYTEHHTPPLEEIVAVGEKYGWSPGEGPLATESSAPAVVTHRRFRTGAANRTLGRAYGSSVRLGTVYGY